MQPGLGKSKKCLFVSPSSLELCCVKGIKSFSYLKKENDVNVASLQTFGKTAFKLKKVSARFRNTSAIKKIMKPAVGVSLDVNKDELISASLMCSENQNVLVQLLYNDNKS